MDIEIECCIGCHKQPTTEPSIPGIRCINEACELKPGVRAETLLVAIQLWNVLWRANQIG